MSVRVRASGVAASYGGEPALTGVDFEAAGGQLIAVLGPNGGGKTTLFRALLGEIAVVAGEAWVERPVAYLRQGDRERLDLPVSARDVALMGALARGRWWLPVRRGEREAAESALARVGLEAEADSLYGELSGGQRRRALIARAIVQDAAVLLLDEPLGGVDPASAELIGRLFAELRAEGRTLLVSTHDVEGARAADRVLCLNRRQIAFAEPAAALAAAVLEETYGSEIVVLDRDGEQVRALAVQHHDH